MKKLIIAGLLFFGAVPVHAQDWVSIEPKIKESVVEISIAGKGACTGFVIDSAHDLILTAAHCDNPAKSGEDLYADLLPARVRSKDVKTDLMVLYVEGMDRPALKLAKSDPEVGTPVASLGYGYALETPLFRPTYISAKDIAVERARYIAISSTIVDGQSGGPVVNLAGEVVMLIQLGNPFIGLGVGAEVLKDKMGRFFAQ